MKKLAIALHVTSDFLLFETDECGQMIACATSSKRFHACRWKSKNWYEACSMQCL
jgi:hypothetical protein